MELASETIDAILAYMETRLNPFPFGLHAVECVVESVCHLAPHLNGKQTGGDMHPVSSFLRAIEFLERLSNTLGAARRALKVLGDIITKGRQMVFNSGECSGQNLPSCTGPIQLDLLEPLSDDLISSDRSQLNLQGLNWDPLSRVSGVFPHLDWGLATDSTVDDFLQDFGYGSSPFGVSL